MANFLAQNWRQQPGQPTRINRQERFGKNAVFFCYKAAGRMFDAVTGQSATTDTSVVKGELEPFGGSIAAANYSGTQTAIFAEQPSFDCAGVLSILALVKPSALSGYGAIVSNEDAPDTNGFEFRLGLNATHSELILIRANTAVSYNTALASGNDAIAAGNTSYIAAVISDPNAINAVNTYYYAAGNAPVLATGGGTSSGAGTGAPVAGQKLYVGRRTDGVTQFAGSILWVIGIAEILSAADLEDIRRRPWSLLRPYSRPYMWPVTAATAAAVVSRPLNINQAVNRAATY